MLLSCKCLNFNASSKNQLIKSNIGATESVAVTSPLSYEDGNNADSGVSNGDLVDNSRSLIMTLTQAFMKKFPTTFPFHSQCVEFFKQSILQVSDLVINAINQRDLIYNFTLETQQSDNGNQHQAQSWIFYICINCNTVLYGKKISTSPQSPHMIDDIQSVTYAQQQYIVNCSLLTNNEELSHRRSDNSFSETFGILILDYPQLKHSKNFFQQSAITNNITVGSLGASTMLNLDLKQQRMNQLQKTLQSRIQKEIVDTDERIQRYSDQQFALLKNFRERSEVEFRLLANLIKGMPEQYTCSEQPLPKTEGNLGLNVQRRRNTVDGRCDLNTQTTDTLVPSVCTTDKSSVMTRELQAITPLPNSLTNLLDATINNEPTQQCKVGEQAGVPNNVTGGSTFTELLQRKMSNFDTPPATPEAVPMSVGNSPNFRQLKQQNNVSSFNAMRLPTVNNSFPQSSLSAEVVDDNVFEMEGVDSDNVAPYSLDDISNNYLPITEDVNNHGHYRSTMSQLEESDSAEEAEDALGLDSSESIPVQEIRYRRSLMGQMSNFAKSLPIQIANSPLAERRNATNKDNCDESDLSDTVDIAASIKALAKSVHGEAVFGDLPKPRLSSQI